MASYIKERTKNAQFIVISLRNNMFELASRLVGVYKVNHMVSDSSTVVGDTRVRLTASITDKERDGRKQRLYQTRVARRIGTAVTGSVIIMIG